MIDQARVLACVTDERIRQIRLKRSGRFLHTPDEVSPSVGAIMLMEEVGEVARALCEQDDKQLRKELIQVAAVAVAIVEGLDRRRIVEAVTTGAV